MSVRKINNIFKRLDLVSQFTGKITTNIPIKRKTGKRQILQKIETTNLIAGVEVTIIVLSLFVLLLHVLLLLKTILHLLFSLLICLCSIQMDCRKS